MNTSEKVLGIAQKGSEKRLVVTHITIRESVFFLITKFIAIEAVATVAIIFVQSTLIFGNSVESLRIFLQSFGIPLSFILAVLKILLEIIVILQWLENYYEITPNEVIHRSGIIFKKERRDSLEHLGGLKLTQGFWGRIFRYGNLKLFNWATEKDMTFYLINNPKKYHTILQKLLPKADREKEVFREELIEDEDKE